MWPADAELGPEAVRAGGASRVGRIRKNTGLAWALEKGCG